MKSEEIEYLNAFNLLLDIGPARLQKIEETFGSFKAAWKAKIENFPKEGFSAKLLAKIEALRQRTQPARISEQMLRQGIKSLVFQDEAFPKLLKEISGCPYILYLKGNEAILNEPSLAVVGTRKASFQGREFTRQISKRLAESGLNIISGLALGIDSQAHRGTLEGSGRTVACLASSLEKEKIFPKENITLAEEVIQTGGALLSEYPLYTSPLRANFHQRNRIISGLSLGVLVIEAPEKSGALVTASFAKKQKRVIFAVPGNPYLANAQGPNRLLKEGAVFVTQAEDVIARLDRRKEVKKARVKKSRAFFSRDPQEKKILEALIAEPLDMNRLARLTGIAIPALSAKLTKMELEGKIRDTGARRYALAQK